MVGPSTQRGPRSAGDLAGGVLAWLERHRRRVVNGSRALDLEISKARQYAALEAAGIRTPDTVVIAGKELLAEAARQHFGGGPFIMKPNRGGKGLGVRLFHSPGAFADYIDSPDYEPPVDGLHLLPPYLRAPLPPPVNAPRLHPQQYARPCRPRRAWVPGMAMYSVNIPDPSGAPPRPCRSRWLGRPRRYGRFRVGRHGLPGRAPGRRSARRSASRHRARD